MALTIMASACGQSGSDGAEAPGSDNADVPGAGDGTEATTTLRTVPGADGEAPEAFVELPLEEKIEVFLETPSSSLASNIAAEMGLDGDLRWGPWLLDLLRLGPSNTTDEQVAGALSLLSGIPRDDRQSVIVDYRVFGRWVYDQAIDPGPGYREWKTSLYEPIDDDYQALLGSVDDDLVLSRIQWGGVPRGGIPELNHPERVSGAAADWMVDDEVVFGAIVDGLPVAYPFRILGHHELANDTIGDTPVALVFCTLCRTALLFDRRVEGQTLDLQTSGLLINSNKIMVDTQTDTLWHHLEAVGIGGALGGVELDQLALETTTWGRWIEAHPETEVLAIPDPIFRDNPEQPPIAYDYEPDSPYRFYYDDPEVWFPILDTPTDDIELKSAVVGVDLGGAALAVAVDAIATSGPRVFEVGDGAIVVLPIGATGARVYDATGTGLTDGATPEVIEADEETAVVAVGTGGGSSEAGEVVLSRLIANQGLWFAWFGSHPDTDWWPRSG
jgi:hypothetical protein